MTALLNLYSKQFIFSILTILFAVTVLAQPSGNSTLQFTGGDKVFNGGFANTSTATATVEMWLKLQAHSGTIFTRMNFSNESNNGIALGIQSSSQWILSVGQDGNRTLQYITVSVSLNTWVHVAVTFNNGTATLYVNGVSKGSSSRGTVLNSTYAYSFGSFHPWGDYGLTGGSEIDDIRIFNSVRTPSEISSDMTSISANGAVAFWKMDEGEGDTVADASGNGNNGFLGSTNGSAEVNNPTWNVLTPPIEPTGFFAISENGQVTLKWNQNAADKFSKYYIYMGTNINSLSLFDSTSSVSDTTKTITGLTNGILYYFKVKAKDTNGLSSPFSNLDAAVPVESSGNAMIFDGVNDYVSLGNILNITGDMTLEAWVYSENYSKTSRIISKWDSGAGYELMVYSGEIWFTLNQSISAQASIAEYSGEWVHLAATKSGTISKIYINGVLAASGTASDTTKISSNSLLIGEMANLADSYFEGKIDEVRIWSVARTQSEISDNMMIPLRGDETGLAGLWHFDEYSISTLFDATPYNNNGVPVNGPTFVYSNAMGQVTVPVEMTSFTFSGNKLLWSTATETNNAGWEIEGRQLTTGNGQQMNSEFRKIGFVAGKGTTTEKQNYSFTLPFTHNTSQLQFRLKQIDTDGKFSYSNILSVDLTPETFSLSQNYPNPFNPTTSISYQLKANSFVSLKVFDLLGREVKTLVNEEKPAGSYSLNFSAVDLPSGVYFYKLTAGSFTETKKMTVMK